MKIAGILFLLLCALQSLANAADEISLFALNGAGGKFWTMKLFISDRPESCKLEYSGTPHSHTLAKEDCADLRKKLIAVSNQIARHQVSQKKPESLSASDEPNYEFEYKKVQFYVNFRAPKECELSPTGELYPCKVNSLSAAEELLLKLRAYK